MMNLQCSRMTRPMALLLVVSLTAPSFLAGCGGGTSETQPVGPSGGSTTVRRPVQPVRQPAARRGLTTKQKVVMLAGAAALYYLYKKHQNAKAERGPQGRYFLSKNGRVYYRDLRTGEYRWVSPPRQPIAVPADEAQEYRAYQGYNNSPRGRSFGGYGTGAPAYEDVVPAQDIS